jgi:hypothetical protein
MIMDTLRVIQGKVDFYTNKSTFKPLKQSYESAGPSEPIKKRELSTKKAYVVSLSSEALNPNTTERLETKLNYEKKTFEIKQDIEAASKKRELDSEANRFEREQTSEKRQFEEKQRIEKNRFIENQRNKT